jgi:hypothetical protein
MNDVQKKNLGDPKASLSDDDVPYDGPVYVSDFDRFFASPDEAEEWVWDNGKCPTTVEAHPCKVVKAGTPNLIECIEENWYNSHDDEPWGVSRPLAALLNTALEMAAPAPPDLWDPLIKERITLSPFECPECGVPSNEAWGDLRGPCHFCARPHDEEQAFAALVAALIGGNAPPS